MNRTSFNRTSTIAAVTGAAMAFSSFAVQPALAAGPDDGLPAVSHSAPGNGITDISSRRRYGGGVPRAVLGVAAGILALGLASNYRGRYYGGYGYGYAPRHRYYGGGGSPRVYGGGSPQGHRRWW